jgi:hypothetical protein
MRMAWITTLACLALLVFLLLRRAPAGEARPGALAQLAELHGVRRILGESDESLRLRTAGASRWPFSYPEPKFVWWARAWHRIRAFAGASR